MKKIKMAVAMIVFGCTLSSCGRTEDLGNTQMDEEVDPVEISEDNPQAVSDEALYHAAKESAKSPQDEQTDDGDLLYEAFLKNEIGVINPYVEDMKLTVMDDKNYESEFEDAKKRYVYVDVNSDDNPELIFQISSDTSELMYILGIYDNELICFDVFETHTPNISFGVYDYGFVWQVQDYDGFEMTFYTYTADGQPVRARRFTEDNRADIAAHEGEEPQWIDWQVKTEDN